MVKITIYVEGGANNAPENSPDQTIDNSALFREGFHRLFKQSLSEYDFELIIQPIGSVTQAKEYLEKIKKKALNAIILIDLDDSKEKKQEILSKRYANTDTSVLFFMIQEMEAWILSQPHTIEEYARQIGLIRKKTEQTLEDSPLIKGKHPEEIKSPSEKLNTLFRQFFAQKKKVNGKLKNKPKRYSKTKDGPKLIALLELSTLRKTSDEVERMITFLLEKKDSKF